MSPIPSYHGNGKCTSEQDGGRLRNGCVLMSVFCLLCRSKFGLYYALSNGKYYFINLLLYTETPLSRGLKSALIPRSNVAHIDACMKAFILRMYLLHTNRDLLIAGCFCCSSPFADKYLSFCHHDQQNFPLKVSCFCLTLTF